VNQTLSCIDAIDPVRRKFMVSETISKSKFGRVFIKVLAAGMESRFRYRFFGPGNILKGADILPGQAVLEVGCGTGYFTIPAARLIGGTGCLVSMDVLQDSVDLVSGKVQAAGLKNVRVIKADAQSTGLDAESFDKVLLFGVIPAPMLPLSRLLPELSRVLKAGGTLAVWPPVPGWLPQSILQSGMFDYSGKRNNVHNFSRR
jgi:demethylmenaquinone methyltransferase/2-methoxy-6-polyprenyl-1,4-benzoquinol methylase